MMKRMILNVNPNPIFNFTAFIQSLTLPENTVTVSLLIMLKCISESLTESDSFH